jgi:hypothetical protein
MMHEIYKQIFEIPELKVGHAVFRKGPHNIKTSQLMISKIWQLQIRPSFSPNAEITFLETKRSEYQFEDEIKNGWVKMALRTDEGFHEVVQLLSSYDDSSWMSSIDLTPVSNTVTLDGVGYSFTLGTSECDLSLSFSNPRIPSLRNLVNEIYELAKESFNSDQSHDFLKNWNGHI